MKQVIIKYLLALVALFGWQSAEAATATEVLDKAAGNISRASSVTIKFVAGGTDGSLTVGKEKFTFTAQGLSVWYDGKTQWALDKRAREVSITEPTPSELLESNPLKILSSWQSHYTAKLLTAKAGQFRVELTAKKKGVAVSSAIVVLNAKTYVPVSIELMGSGGKTLFTISAFTTGKALPKSYFTFDAKQQPGITINDLR